MNKQFKTEDGILYERDQYGVVHQVDPEIIDYNEAYVDTYRSEAYKEKSAQLMGIRLGSVISLFSSEFDKQPNSILDVGYGDGSFLNLAKEAIPNCFGLDITDEEPPEGTRRVEDYRYHMDVITFWDAFEHIPDLSFIEHVPAKMIIMSMPDLTGYDFDKWKHRKPGEHLHHFTPGSLADLMLSYGWEPHSFNHQEDAIRKANGGYPNIITASFTKPAAI